MVTWPPVTPCITFRSMSWLARFRAGTHLAARCPALGPALGPATAQAPVLALALALALLLPATDAQAQAPQNTTVNVNYVYAADLGFGGYRLAGLSADVYTLPLATSFADVPADGWSLRLLLPIQLGLYDFKASYQGTPIELHQQSLSAVPGVELQIPAGDRLVIKPFVQFGAVHGFGTDGQNADAWVYLAGARSVLERSAGDTTLSIGSGIVFAGDQTIGPGFGEHYVSLQLAAEVRRPLGFKVGGWTPDVGLYAAEYFYPAPLHFSRFLRSPLKVYNQNEIGFSVGAAEPMKILWLDHPRLGAGFVFGGRLNVYHVNFGFPF